MIFACCFGLLPLNWIYILPCLTHVSTYRILCLSWIEQSEWVFRRWRPTKELLFTLIRSNSAPTSSTNPSHANTQWVYPHGTPEKFNDSADRCRGFLCQCGNFFTHQPTFYQEETTKCNFILCLLTGKATDWASAVWDSDPQVKSSFMYISELIRKVFEYPAGRCNVAVPTPGVVPRHWTSHGLCCEIPHTGIPQWVEWSLLTVFREGLCPTLQEEMACPSMNVTLSEYITTAIQLDNLLHQQRRTPQTWEDYDRP